MDAEQRRIYAAMLDSLAMTFRLFGDTGTMMCSFNAYDVEKMLKAVSKEIEPKLQSVK